MSSMRVIVEDEQRMASLIRDGVQREGPSADVAGTEASSRLSSGSRMHAARVQPLVLLPNRRLHERNGEALPEGDYRVGIYRFIGRRAPRILRPRNFRRFLDAGEGKALVLEPKSELAV